MPESSIHKVRVVASGLHLRYYANMKIDTINMLKNKKLKVTPARVTVLSMFSENCKPMNAEDIFNKFKKEIDRVTVYRTLASFEKNKILKRVDLRKDSVYYELASHHHHHITCTDCGAIESFETCEIQNVSKKILNKSSKFNSINQHSLELFGVCKSCSKV